MVVLNISTVMTLVLHSCIINNILIFIKYKTVHFSSLNNLSSPTVLFTPHEILFKCKDQAGSRLLYKGDFEELICFNS